MKSESPLLISDLIITGKTRRLFLLEFTIALFKSSVKRSTICFVVTLHSVSLTVPRKYRFQVPLLNSAALSVIFICIFPDEGITLHIGNKDGCRDQKAEVVINLFVRN